MGGDTCDLSSITDELDIASSARNSDADIETLTNVLESLELQQCIVANALEQDCDAEFREQAEHMRRALEQEVAQLNACILEKSAQDSDAKLAQSLHRRLNGDYETVYPHTSVYDTPANPAPKSDWLEQQSARVEFGMHSITTDSIVRRVSYNKHIAILPQCPQPHAIVTQSIVDYADLLVACDAMSNEDLEKCAFPEYRSLDCGGFSANQSTAALIVYINRQTYAHAYNLTQKLVVRVQKGQFIKRKADVALELVLGFVHHISNLKAFVGALNTGYLHTHVKELCVFCKKNKIVAFSPGLAMLETTLAKAYMLSRLCEKPSNESEIFAAIDAWILARTQRPVYIAKESS